jgi:flagellar assembly protein FliH
MSEQVKPAAQVSKLLRANDAQVSAIDQWQAPDLMALKAKEAEQAFQRLLAQTKAEVAAELALMREADRREAFEQGRQQGLTKGYEEGYALGLKEAQAVVDQSFASKMAEWDAEKASLRQDWQQLFAQMAQVFDVLDDAFFDQMVWLSQQMAERILRAELQLKPEHIQRVVRDAFAELPKLVYPITVQLNADDVALVQDLVFDAEQTIQFVVNEQFQRGECRVISGHAEVWHSWQLLSTQVMDQMLSHFAELQLQARTSSEPAMSSDSQQDATTATAEDKTSL